MKPERLHEQLPPGEEDACRQQWKHNPATWREKFFARNPQLSENPLECTRHFGGRAHQVADAMETYFETALPKWEHRVQTKGKYKGERY